VYGLERHGVYWQKASENLRNVIGKLTVTFENADIKKRMEDISKKISIEK